MKTINPKILAAAQSGQFNNLPLDDKVRLAFAIIRTLCPELITDHDRQIMACNMQASAYKTYTDAWWATRRRDKAGPLDSALGWALKGDVQGATDCALAAAAEWSQENLSIAAARALAGEFLKPAR